MTRDEALGVWALLSAAARGRELSDDDLEIRAELISDLEFTETRVAAIRLARTADWLPSVAELRKAVSSPALPDAGEAWGEVVRVVHRLGWPTPPTEKDFSDPVIYRAVQALGTWQDFCSSDETIMRAHFLKTFPVLAERVRNNAAAGPLPDIAIGPAPPLPDLRLSRDDQP